MLWSVGVPQRVQKLGRVVVVDQKHCCYHLLSPLEKQRYHPPHFDQFEICMMVAADAHSCNVIAIIPSRSPSNHHCTYFHLMTRTYSQSEVCTLLCNPTSTSPPSLIFSLMNESNKNNCSIPLNT